MIGRDSYEDLNRYGLVPWVLGLVLAAFLIWVMFEYALPIGATDS